MRSLNIKNWILVAAMALLSWAVSAQASSDMDNRIESAAKNSHVFKTYLKGDTVEINSKEGMVTLTGTVSDSSHKSLAKEIVENLPGVMKVTNRIIIRGPGDQRNQDAWIATKVKTTLMFHRNVNAFNTQVRVKDGMATLQGLADTSSHKDLTTEYAKDVEGVKSVNNQMTVASESSEKSEVALAEKIDDASITAQVKMALLYHNSTSALKTKVKTVDGVVRLSGKANNSSEKDLVTKLVMNINGVSNVENHMTIAPKSLAEAL